MLRVLFCFADLPIEMNCSKYLCLQPAEAFNKSGLCQASYMHISHFLSNTPEIQNIVMQADIIIIERNLFMDTLALMQHYKGLNKSFVICFDDGYSVINDLNASVKFWKTGEIKTTGPNGEQSTGYITPIPITQLGWGISMAKGYQVVSEQLRQDWELCNPEGFVINHHILTENYINVKEPLFDHSNIIIGNSTSLSHVESFEGSGLLIALKKIVKKYKNVTILQTGDKRVFDLMDIPEGRKIFMPFVPPQEYAPLIKTMDIFLIPLYHEFDKRRSQVKPLEASALKVPFLATDFPNYSHIKPYGNFTENGWENWYNKLSDMIENLPKYKQFANDVSYPWALTQDLNLHLQERLDLYQHLIEIPYSPNILWKDK